MNPDYQFLHWSLQWFASALAAAARQANGVLMHDSMGDVRNYMYTHSKTPSWVGDSRRSRMVESLAEEEEEEWAKEEDEEEKVEEGGVNEEVGKRNNRMKGKNMQWKKEKGERKREEKKKRRGL